MFGPGIAAHLALAPGRHGMLERIAVGGGLGHALALAAFMATAAIGERDLFFAYPPLVLLAGGVAMRARRAADGPPPLTRHQAAAVAAVAAVALVYLVAGSFTQTPVPESKPSVSYYPDLVWGMSFAAEAQNHWPMTTPQVAGEPVRYHTFVFIHMAAMAQATGIDLPVVVLRLVPLSLLMLLVLQLTWAGRRLTGRAWAGPVAAALLLVVGDLDLGVGRPEPFLGFYFSGLFLSPTQLLGLVFFVPALVAIRDMLEAGVRRPSARELGLAALLLFGCAGAKAAILPVLVAGLLLYGLWRRRAEAGWLVPLALTFVALALAYALLYSDGRGTTDIGPFESSLRSFPGLALEPYSDDGVLAALVYPLATVVTVCAVLLPLVGLAWAVRRPLGPTQAWLLALFAAAATAFFALDLPGGSQFYFLWFGYTAAAFLSAAGLLEAAPRLRAGPRWALSAAVAAGVLLGVDPGIGSFPVEVFYIPLLLGLAALVVVHRRAWPGVAAAAALLVAGTLDGPVDRLPVLADRALDGSRTLHSTADRAAVRGVTRQLAKDLRWVSDNTPESAVLAVNNHFLIEGSRDSRYFYYSALAQRRVFIESWDYTDRAYEIGQERVRAGQVPYPERLALNDRALAGDAAAVRRLRRRGVTHLLVDLVNGNPPASPLPGREVYRSEALVLQRIG